MAKIYKVSFYATDCSDNFEDKEHFKNILEEVLYDLDVMIDFLEIEESERFKWNVDLKINSLKSTKEDFEEYFK